MKGENSLDAPELYLRELRQVLDLSRDQFAAQIGVSHRQLVRIENGENRIKLEHLHQAVRAFNIPAHHLLRLATGNLTRGDVLAMIGELDESQTTQPEPPTTSSVDLMGSTERRELLDRLISTLSAEQLRLLSTLVESIATDARELNYVKGYLDSSVAMLRRREQETQDDEPSASLSPAS